MVNGPVLIVISNVTIINDLDSGKSDMLDLWVSFLFGKIAAWICFSKLQTIMELGIQWK